MFGMRPAEFFSGFLSWRQSPAQHRAQARVAQARRAFNEHLEMGRGARREHLPEPIVFCSFAISVFCVSMAALFYFGVAHARGPWPVPPHAMSAGFVALGSFMCFWGFRRIGLLRQDELAIARANLIFLQHGPGAGMRFRSHEANLRAELAAAEEAMALAKLCVAPAIASAVRQEAPGPTGSHRRQPAPAAPRARRI